MKEEAMYDLGHQPNGNGRSSAEHEAVVTARELDGRLGGRALILGTLPPEGRDLDLVVRRPQRKAAAAALTVDGFLPRGPALAPRRRWVEQWVRFRAGSAFSVDLNPAERWGLPAAELEALFSEARAIEGLDQIARPAPHHALLLVARRLVRSGGLDAKRRSRVERALAEDPTAWAVAAERAPLWGLVPALALLRQVYESDAPVSPRARKRALATMLGAGGPRFWAESVARRARSLVPRRTRVVSLSGLDGAGKSSQSTAIQQTLADLGVDVTIEWMPLGHSPRYRSIRAVRAFAGALVGGLSRVRGAGRSSAKAEATGPFTGKTSAAKSLRQRSGAVTQGWTIVVALHQALQHRKATLKHLGRGKVVIFDRYALDSAAQLRFFYGSENAFRVQKWLIDRISPTPRRSYLLEVPPPVVAARKELQYSLEGVYEQAALLVEEGARLGVVRLDGERPREEITQQIARELWQASA